MKEMFFLYTKEMPHCVLHLLSSDSVVNHDWPTLHFCYYELLVARVVASRVAACSSTTSSSRSTTTTRDTSRSSRLEDVVV